MPRKKKQNKPSKKKLLIEWSKQVRNRDCNKCVICGKTEHIQAHHILQKKRFPEYQFCLENGISLCPTHHNFGHFSAHMNAVFFSEWLRLNRPEQFRWVLEKMVEWKKNRLHNNITTAENSNMQP